MFFQQIASKTLSETPLVVTWSSWKPLWASWGPLGELLEALVAWGASWRSLGVVLDRLGSSFIDLGALLGPLGVLLGSLGGLLGASWKHFGGIFEASKTKKKPPSTQASKPPI